MAAPRDSAFLRAVLAAHPRQFGAAMERAPELRFQARAAPPARPAGQGRCRSLTADQPPSRAAQVLVSEVREGGRGGEPELLRHGFRADEEYFYPASHMNAPASLTPPHPVPPASLAALAKVLQRHLTLALSSPWLCLGWLQLHQDLCCHCGPPGAVASANQPGYALAGVELSPITPLTVLPLFSSYPDAQDKDSSNLNGGRITVAHEIRKLFLARHLPMSPAWSTFLGKGACRTEQGPALASWRVSDNQAYNRLYALVGQKRLNQAMWDAGLSSVRLRHRLSLPLTAEENHFCEPLEIGVEQQPFSIPPKHNLAKLPLDRHHVGALVGKAYVKDGSQLVKKPMDFSVKNVASLVDLQDLLVKLMRSDIHPGSPGLLLSSGQRQLLQEAMLQYPSQSHSPRYSAREFPDDYCKFFLPGLCKVRPKAAIRVYNKVGQAYGFTVDNSYVFDVETGRSFFMSMSIYTNANGVLDDDKYEYDTALRLAADLGEVIARAIWQVPHRYTVNKPLTSNREIQPCSELVEERQQTPDLMECPAESSLQGVAKRRSSSVSCGMAGLTSSRTKRDIQHKCHETGTLRAGAFDCTKSQAKAAWVADELVDYSSQTNLAPQQGARPDQEARADEQACPLGEGSEATLLLAAASSCSHPMGMIDAELASASNLADALTSTLTMCTAEQTEDLLHHSLGAAVCTDKLRESASRYLEVV
eukprot:SM000222S06962  [mRNA]  locus=s222:76548:81596:+ [translate_table: standard]